jgi:DNA-binding NarL/FixJ family response regulator
VSSSADPTDVEYAYRNSANCYVTKPADLDGFMDAVRRIADLWCGVAELPC